ncbi:MAG TPA: PDZ domain-containing protein [Gemmataceae bacterium]|nr:PDZ domain-containing protein [Gemmataceae bacterium]
MSWRATLSLLLLPACVGVAAAQAPADLEALQEQAVQAAVRRVAPSVVRIETSGGAELIGSGPRGPQVRKGTGPTTGLVVSADGYVLSSAFNFANKPSAILVWVPGHKDGHVAHVVATDHTRMLTLLKINTAEFLPVPEPAPKAGVRIGQTALALGRTFDTPGQLPSVSVGIVSALGRIWGKAVQTDAKVSPANYGGPLVDLYGRVIGVLVPASPRGDDETAGVEWYDSGIGFAVPLADINAVLPRLKAGKDLQRGMLGIQPKSPDQFAAAPAVGTVLPHSAADKAGIKSGDVLEEIDGRPVANQAQVMHALGAKYEGDIVSVKVRRGKQELTFAKVVLGSAAQSTALPFLGILPLRDDPEPGVAVRYVYPKGPADAAGIQAGDRVMKIGGASGPLRPVAGRDALATMLSTATPGMDVRVEVRRKAGGKTDTLTLKVGEMPDTVPAELPREASRKKALEVRQATGPMPAGGDGEKPEAKKAPKKKPETGLLLRRNATGDHQYFVYVPKDYDPNISYGLVVWLHPVGKNKKQDIDDFTDTWEDYCKANHLILLGPKAESETGWVAGESDFVQEAVRSVLAEYTIDRRRVVAHGMGVGGQMALYLGFHARGLVRGVATTGAALSGAPKERVVNQPVAFFLAVGGKDPLAKAVAETRDKLTGHKYSVVYREIANGGRQYLDEKTLDELVRWIDSLDRI